jgi:hypothetical protein
MIADLQHGPQAPTSPAVHQAEVTAVSARQQLQNRSRFAMRPD